MVQDDFTDGSWKMWGTLMSFTSPLFERKLYISFALFFGCRYRWFKYLRLNSIQSRGIPLKVYRFSIIIYIILKENCCNFKINLFIAKRDTRKKLGASHKLRMKWCFISVRNSSGEKELFLLIFLWETLLWRSHPFHSAQPEDKKNPASNLLPL